MQKQPVIEVENVSYTYDGGGNVLDHVSVTIDDRDFVSIIGPNGGGKTTLLRIMLGLLRPATGSVKVFGVTPELGRHRIGYMPQRANLDPQFPVNVLDVVLMGRLGCGGRMTGRHDAQGRAKAREALARVALSGLERRPFAALSGGQRQRVLIARALAGDPDILLFDEPTSNLDIVSQNDLYELLHALNKQMTVVMVSHDVAFVSKYVHTIVCVNRVLDVHAASDIAGSTISEMYGHDMRMIVHHHKHE